MLPLIHRSQFCLVKYCYWYSNAIQMKRKLSRVHKYLQVYCIFSVLSLLHCCIVVSFQRGLKQTIQQCKKLTKYAVHLQMILCC